jgi:hypothetical protein
VLCALFRRVASLIGSFSQSDIGFGGHPDCEVALSLPPEESETRFGCICCTTLCDSIEISP